MGNPSGRMPYKSKIEFVGNCLSFIDFEAQTQDLKRNPSKIQTSYEPSIIFVSGNDTSHQHGFRFLNFVSLC